MLITSGNLFLTIKSLRGTILLYISWTSDKFSKTTWNIFTFLDIYLKPQINSQIQPEIYLHTDIFSKTTLNIFTYFDMYLELQIYFGKQPEIYLHTLTYILSFRYIFKNNLKYIYILWHISELQIYLKNNLKYIYIFWHISWTSKIFWKTSDKFSKTTWNIFTYFDIYLELQIYFQKQPEIYSHT